MVIHYKCPHCGADMSFNSNTGMLSCPSCSHQVNVSDYDSSHREAAFSEGDVQEFHCQNCGAVLLTDQNTSATSCSYCGAPVVLSERLSGSAAPAFVIPFTVSKEQATAQFKKWCRHGLLTPKGFMKADRIKNITGIYVPFWLYDIGGQADVTATATKVHTYTRGDYIYTETSYFNVYRNLGLNFNKVPVDASEKMNDVLMDQLEPFHYKDLKDFQMPYLAGFLAEKYNFDADQLLPRVDKRINTYAEQLIRESINGYSTVNYLSKNINTHLKRAHYALFPIWMVCYDYRQSEHIFAMNGQTGKLVGTPPLSKGKAAAWFGGIFAGLLIIFRLFQVIAGGGFL